MQKTSPHYSIRLIKRKISKNTKFKTLKIYDIVVSSKNKLKKKVINKLGSLDYINKKLVLNFFRLVFWISQNISISSAFMRVLLKYKIFSLTFE